MQANQYHEPILAVVACTQRSSALALSGLDPVTTGGIFVLVVDLVAFCLVLF